MIKFSFNKKTDFRNILGSSVPTILRLFDREGKTPNQPRVEKVEVLSIVGVPCPHCGVPDKIIQVKHKGFRILPERINDPEMSAEEQLKIQETIMSFEKNRSSEKDESDAKSPYVCTGCTRRIKAKQLLEKIPVYSD